MGSGTMGYSEQNQLTSALCSASRSAQVSSKHWPGGIKNSGFDGFKRSGATSPMLLESKPL